MVFALQTPGSRPDHDEAGQPVPLRGLLADSRVLEAASISPVVMRGSVRAVEAIVIALLGAVIALSYVDKLNLIAGVYAIAITSACLIMLGTFELLGLYSIRSLSAFVANVPAVLFGWTIALAVVVASVFFLKIGAEVSRFWLGTWYISGAVGLIIVRITISRLMRRWAKDGRLYQRAFIYGAGPVTDELIRELEADNDTIVRIAGIFDDRDEERAPRQIGGYPRLGGLNDLMTLSRQIRLDLIIVALPLAAEERLTAVVKRLAVLPADVKMPARSTALRFSPRVYSHVGSVAMIDLYEKPLSGWDTVSKWLFDKAVGSLALITLAPVMAVVALAVKLDSKGPVLFRQKRYGFNNEPIDVFKFRSMYTDLCDADAKNLVTKDDPRVTRVGRFIRKTSLDELPQLFNVILGTLSLVGPRPHAMQAKAGTQLYHDVVDGYFARHKVKPGITGWAQINGWRGETDTEEKILKRVEHDLYYIENWSLFFDVYILLKTPASLIKSESAY